MRSVVELPTSIDEFLPLLNDESWCTAYAFTSKWPNGFICPVCASHQPQTRPERKMVCRFCGRRSSITAGTLLHGSKKKLSIWFQAIWWLSAEKSSLTINNLQRRLSLNSYQTAWLWMTKLRSAMKLLGDKKCLGTVLIDAELVNGEDTQEPARLLAVVESIAEGRAVGRLRMRFSDSLDPDHIATFCSRCADPGSVIAAPGREPFTSVQLGDLLYTIDAARVCHDTVQNIFLTYRRWCSRKKYRLSHFKSPQDCLEEFCFLQNSALYSSKLHLFEALISEILHHNPNQAGYQVRTADQERGAA